MFLSSTNTIHSPANTFSFKREISGVEDECHFFNKKSKNNTHNTLEAQSNHTLPLGSESNIAWPKKGMLLTALYDPKANPILYPPYLQNLQDSSISRGHFTENKIDYTFIKSGVSIIRNSIEDKKSQVIAEKTIAIITNPKSNIIDFKNLCASYKFSLLIALKILQKFHQKCIHTKDIMNIYTGKSHIFKLVNPEYSHYIKYLAHKIRTLCVLKNIISFNEKTKHLEKKSDINKEIELFNKKIALLKIQDNEFIKLVENLFFSKKNYDTCNKCNQKYTISNILNFIYKKIINKIENKIIQEIVKNNMLA